MQPRSWAILPLALVLLLGMIATADARPRILETAGYGHEESVERASPPPDTRADEGGDPDGVGLDNPHEFLPPSASLGAASAGTPSRFLILQAVAATLHDVLW